MTPRAILTRAALAMVLLHVAVLFRPALLYDDFDIIMRCRTWTEVGANLWVPQNEHTMPLGHLSTGVLVTLSPDLRVLAYLCALQGILATGLGMGLIYLFVRREVGLPLVGVVSAVVFGVTSSYQQAVTWFAASFSVLALDFFLLGLLAAQAWRHTRRGLYLDGCLLACFLAPGWFASGILAGPLCFLYLLLPERTDGSRFGQVSVAPLVGTALYLALALPRAAQTILHLEHYRGKTALEVFDVVTGLGSTCRSLIDNLLLGQFGITHICTPVWLLAILLPVLLALVVLWLRPGAEWRLVVVGAATIIGPYLLTYSARSTWGYVESGMYTHVWSRYHLFPQLGLCLLLAAGLPYWLARLGRWLKPEEDGITPAQGWGVCALIVCLALIHLPRGLLGTPKEWDQWPNLGHLAEVDARCRETGISRDLAVKVLPEWKQFPGAPEQLNAWQLLRGSSTPRELSPEEARLLLQRKEPGE